MNSVRESIPVEAILRAYMDETEEQHVDVKEVQEKIAIEPPKPKEAPAPAAAQIVAPAPAQIVAAPTQIQTPLALTPTNTKLSFSDMDRAIDIKGIETTIEAPKTIERLETISAQSFEKQRHLEEDDDDNDKLRIGGDIKLDFSDINDLNRSLNVRPPPMLDVEILN